MECVQYKTQTVKFLKGAISYTIDYYTMLDKVFVSSCVIWVYPSKYVNIYLTDKKGRNYTYTRNYSRVISTSAKKSMIYLEHKIFYIFLHPPRGFFTLQMVMCQNNERDVMIGSEV